MPLRDPQPPRTNVPRQIILAIKLGVLLTAALFLLYLCARGPLRRWGLDHPRFEVMTTLTFPHAVSALAAGNADGDAFADLVVFHPAARPPRLDLLRGTAQGPDLENPIAIPEGFAPLQIVFGDLDGDGLDDLLATSPSDRSRGMSLWWNRGQARFERVPLLVPLRLADVLDEDQDGQPDLVGLTRNFAQIQVHRVVDGEVNPEPDVEAEVNDRAIRDFAAAHLDGHGMDVAFVANNRVRMLRRGGVIPDMISYFNLPPRLFEAQQTSLQPGSLVLDDINGDGRPDLAFLDVGEIALHLGLGGPDFIPTRHPVSGQAANRLVAGDFDGDGVCDLMTLDTDGTRGEILRGL